MSRPSQFLARPLVRAVRWYQRELSPRKPAPTCRFTPSCSEYAAQALEQHGALRGGWLACWRILRCNPLVPGGYDPVPPRPASPRSGPSRSGPPFSPPSPTDKPS